MEWTNLDQAYLEIFGEHPSIAQPAKPDDPWVLELERVVASQPPMTEERRALLRRQMANYAPEFDDLTEEEYEQRQLRFMRALHARRQPG